MVYICYIDGGVEKNKMRRSRGGGISHRITKQRQQNLNFGEARLRVHRSSCTVLLNFSVNLRVHQN